MSVGYNTRSSSSSPGSDPEVNGYTLEWGKHAPYPQWTVTHKNGRTFEITWDHSEDCPGCIVQVVVGTEPNSGIYNCVSSGSGKTTGTFTKKEGKPLFFDGGLEYTCADAKDKYKNTDWVGKITKGEAPPTQVCCKNTSTGEYQYQTGSCGEEWVQVSDAKCEGGKPKPGILDWITSHKLLIGGGVGGIFILIILLTVIM